MPDIYADSVNGNDSTGDGTIGTPWLTIQKAFDSGISGTPATGGDTIFLADTGAFVLTAEINWTAFGATTVTTPLTIRSYSVDGTITISHAGGATRVAAEIDGNDDAGTTGMFSSTGIEAYVTFLDIRFRRCTGNMNGSNTWRAVACEFTDMGGTLMATLAAVMCYFHDDGGSSCDGFSGVGGSFFNRFDSLTGECVNSGADGVEFIGNLINKIEQTSTPYDDVVNILFNTWEGRGASETLTGLTRVAANQNNVVIGNIFRNFNGTGGEGADLSSVSIAMWNSFYQNTSHLVGTPLVSVENTDPESSDPLTDPDNDDYRVVDGATAEKVIPMHAGTSANMAFANAGAVQNDPDAGGGGGLLTHPGMGGGMRG